MDKLIFSQIANKIINNIEGGYYNPEWHYVLAMGDSGETMYGIDRKHGGSLNTGVAGREFWNTIDAKKTKSKWFHGYMGGDLESKLKGLVSNIMYPYYTELSKQIYPELLKIVNADERLLFHFIYASWNGAGFFKFYADKMNAQYNRGERNPDNLYANALALRKNSKYKVIRNGGAKIENLFKNYPYDQNAIELPEYVVKGKKKSNWLIIALAIATAIILKKKQII